MSRIFLAVCVVAGLLAEPAAAANAYIKGFIQVRHAVTRATPPGAEVAAGYLEVRNTGKEADRIIGASTPAAARVELHTTALEGGVMKMREVKTFEVPAKKRLELKSGGSHLMLVGLRKPFVKGQRIPLTLHFERGGDLHVELVVHAAGAPKAHQSLSAGALSGSVISEW